MDYTKSKNTYFATPKDDPKDRLNLDIRFNNWFDFSAIKKAMVNTMLPAFREKIKVFNPIISFNFVDVVDYFQFRKIPTKMFFNYKSMFRNISLFIFERVVRTSNKAITFATKFDSTFPIIVFFSRIISRFTFIPRDITFYEFTHTISITKDDLIVKPIQEKIIWQI